MACCEADGLTTEKAPSGPWDGPADQRITVRADHRIGSAAPRVVVTRFNSGATMSRNARGRCEDKLDEQLDNIFTCYENELALAPASRAYRNSAPILREKLQAVRAGGYDEDFIVTYAIALGYQGDLQRLRQHYSAARQN
jgi:hypothetical protein